MINPNNAKDQEQVPLARHDLDADGLPFIGRKLEQGQAEQCVYDRVLGKPKYTSFKDSEAARANSNATGEKVDELEGNVRHVRNVLGAMDEEHAADAKAWLPDGYSRIFRIVCVWPFGLLDYGSATLHCKI